jgi:cell division transport system ATP-binding protein
VVELLRWVGLGDRMHCPAAGALRGREAARRHRPGADRAAELLLADEPTGNVDPSLARRLLRLFMELNRLGTSVLIATHDLALMDQLNVRRLVLGDGRLHIDE